jgi:hypothetical protein
MVGALYRIIGGGMLRGDQRGTTLLAVKQTASGPMASVSGRRVWGWGQGIAKARPLPVPAPNNPLELTAHSAGFCGYSLRFPLWAAAHRER